MHTFGVALLPQDVTDARGEISALIASYYSEMEVEEYRDFYSAKYVESLAKRHGAGNDLALLVRILQDKGCDDVGLQDGRFYRLSTYNRNAKWDYWLVGGHYNRKIYNAPSAEMGRCKGWDESLCANMCIVSLLPSDSVPATLITPKGEWHGCEDFGWRMMSAPEAQEKAWAMWEVHARRLLQSFYACLAIGLDVHS